MTDTQVIVTGDTTAQVITAGTQGPAGRGEDFYDVKVLGAVGDGVTDDLAAIQAAINVAQTAGGGTVFFPAGTYVVSGIPTITGTNLVIRGVGHNAKILLAPASMNAAGTTNGLWVNGGSNIIIRDLCIDGNYANIAKNGSYHSASAMWTPVINTYGATSVKNYVYAGSGIDTSTYLKQRIPIRITNAENVTVRDCLIQNSISAGILADATSVNGCTDILITQNRIKLCWDNGVYFHQGVQYGTASQNEISDTTYNGVSAVFCDHIFVTGNNIRNAGPSDSDSGGIQMNGTSHYNVVGNLIDSCQFYGVEALSTQETNITGGAGGNQVWANDGLIEANHITNCHSNNYPSGTSSGINVFGANNTRIKGNAVDKCDYGISLGGHSTNATVTSNDVTHCYSVGARIGNSADILKTIVRSNYFAYNGSDGVYGSAATSYIDNDFIANSGYGLNLDAPPTGIPRKIDYVLGNRFVDNTSSGISTNVGSANVVYLRRNLFTNSAGLIFGDGAITNGSPTLTSATANFTSADVGAVLLVMDQGTSGTLTATTVQTVANSTTVTLTANAVATQSGISFFIGRGTAFFADGVTTDAQNSVLTSATASFSSSDVGKLIIVMTPGINPSATFMGTVSSFTSATQVTLSGNAGAISSGAQFIINRSAGQQSRAINQGNGQVIDRDNDVWGIPEILTGASATLNLQTLNRTIINSQTYTAKVTDRLIAYTALATAKTLTIPDPATMYDKTIVVQDEAGIMGTNNLTIQPATGTINGGANVVITTNYGRKTLYSNGVAWFAS